MLIDIREHSEAVRAFLMLQFGLHADLRQRNLRELRVGFPDVGMISREHEMRRIALER